MARIFYQYTITVLEKVSFDAKLFMKELDKAFNSLLPNEQLELKAWLTRFLQNNPQLKESIHNNVNINNYIIS